MVDLPCFTSQVLESNLANVFRMHTSTGGRGACLEAGTLVFGLVPPPSPFCQQAHTWWEYALPWRMEI